MSFDLTKLENHGGSGAGLKLWSYDGSADTAATIEAAGYFNGASSLLAVGDRIAVRASDDDFDMVVTANASGVVTVRRAGELRASATWNPASLTTGSQATTTVTVTGAALGDKALASFSLDLAGCVMTAYVSAADTVTVVLLNQTGGTVDLASGTLSVSVFT